MTNGTGDPWAGTTYNGFSGARQAAAGRGPRAPRVGAGRWIAAGVAAAALLGVGVGVLTRQDMGDEPGLPERATTVASAEPGVPIEIAAVEPAPAPSRAAPLEVLPPDMARSAAERPVIRVAPPPAPVARRPDVVAAPAVQASAVQAFARAPERAAASPGFDCRYASSRSERLVCGDAQLARLDRRLNRAFEEAVASGVPYRELRQDQDDWLRIREDAARQAGPDGVASVYRQRIAELDDLARDGSGPY
jgi:uncharacterized protein YecT (DUF1311 family)